MKELKDTVNRMNSTDYKERFMAEYDQVTIRREKLKNMLDKYDAGTLPFTPDCPIELLKKQAEVMGEYLNILRERAKYENISII